jgi:hypothetical protein
LCSFFDAKKKLIKIFICLKYSVITFSEIPSIMATSLDLPHLSMYTGLCLRRSSATLLADLEADITTIKRHESWKSIAVAEGYIQDSVQKTANQVCTTSRDFDQQYKSDKPRNYKLNVQKFWMICQFVLLTIVN